MTGAKRKEQNMDKDKKEFLEFLKQLVLEVGGEEDLNLLDELSDIGADFIIRIQKQELLPEDKVKRWNEIIEKLYPDKK